MQRRSPLSQFFWSDTPFATWVWIGLAAFVLSHFAKMGLYYGAMYFTPDVHGGVLEYLSAYNSNVTNAVTGSSGFSSSPGVTALLLLILTITLFAAIEEIVFRGAPLLYLMMVKDAFVGSHRTWGYVFLWLFGILAAISLNTVWINLHIVGDPSTGVAIYLFLLYGISAVFYTWVVLTKGLIAAIGIHTLWNLFVLSTLI